MKNHFNANLTDVSIRSLKIPSAYTYVNYMIEMTYPINHSLYKKTKAPDNLLESLNVV